MGGDAVIDQWKSSLRKETGATSVSVASGGILSRAFSELDALRADREKMCK